MALSIKIVCLTSLDKIINLQEKYQQPSKHFFVLKDSALTEEMHG